MRAAPDDAPIGSLPGVSSFLEAATLPSRLSVEERVAQILDDHRVLKAHVRQCFEAISRGGGLDLAGLRALASKIEESVGLPSSAFGELGDTYMCFDFNGDGSLDFNESYRCVKRCLQSYRRQHSAGLSVDRLVPFKTPKQAGYTVVRILAAGGQGEASLARRVGAGGEEVVLKTYHRDNMNAGGLEELVEEAENMREVAKCEHIAHCFEIFQDQTNLYMISGPNYGGDWTSLRDRAAKQGLPQSEVWFRGIFRQAFRGLAHLHRHALMHCDLKEPNLMLKDTNYARPHVVIIDLGLSKAFFGSGEDGPCGTPGFIPPETWDSGKWYPRGDIFSLAVVCVQVLARKIPDERSSERGIFGEGCASMEDITQATKTRQPPFQLMNPQSPAMLVWLAPCLDKVLARRPRAPQVLEMAWFAESVPTAVAA